MLYLMPQIIKDTVDNLWAIPSCNGKMFFILFVLQNKNQWINVDYKILSDKTLQ